MRIGKFKGQNHPQQVGKRGVDDEVDDRGTPPELFDPLMERFNFTLDVAAAPHNAKCERFFTRHDNGLVRRWSGRVWCNPPYSDLRPWLEKAWSEWGDHRESSVETIVMLLPANRTEQAWWHDLVEPYRFTHHRHEFSVEFIRGRQRFIMPGQTEVLPNQRPPFGVCLLIWERSPSGMTPGDTKAAL